LLLNSIFVNLKNMHAGFYWIAHLKLQYHPDSGNYNAAYRNTEALKQRSSRYRKAIDRFRLPFYYLLSSRRAGHLYKTKSEELWHFLAGISLLKNLSYSGKQTIFRSGINPVDLNQPHVLILVNCWFGADVTRPSNRLTSRITGFDFQWF
jgi:predicted cupin superfamily sugar epimerase